MSRSDRALWSKMLLELRQNHPDVCRRWFDDLEPQSLANGVLTLCVASDIQLNYLRKHCTAVFTEAAQQAAGALLAVAFASGTPSPVEGLVPGLGRAESPSPAPGPQDEPLVLCPDYTFDHFVTGPGNRLAHAGAIAVAEQPGRAYNPLFVHGGVGLGKTHLLQAICQGVLLRNPAAKICYLSCDTFVNQFLEAVGSGQMSDFRNRYRHVDLLMIDDIHFLSNHERTQEEFFHTFNTLHLSNKQIVLSSDSPPNEIPQLEERLTSRFNWGLVARIEKPCYETRLAILKKKTDLRSIRAPDDVLCFIAARIDSNTRELEGAITKVHSLALLRKQPLSLALAREALGEAAESTAPQLTIQHIVDAVTRFYDVKLADLLSKRRHRSITVPRQICMYLARKRTRYSLEEIGGYFGGRDHTTVLHAVRTTQERVTAEQTFRQQVAQIDKDLGRGL